MGTSVLELLTASVPASLAQVTGRPGTGMEMLNRKWPRITDSVGLMQWQVMQACGLFSCRWHEAWR